MDQIFKRIIQVNIIERTFKRCMVKNQEVEIEDETVGVTDKPLLKIQNA